MTGLDETEPTRLADGVSAHAAPVWSPDGKRIAYTSFAGYDPVYETGSIGVRFVDVDSGIETDVTGNEYSLAFNPAWSPDSSQLAFVIKHQGIDERPQHSRGDVMVSNLDGGDFENLTNGEVRYVWSIAWSPQGEDMLLFSLFGQTWYEPPSTSIRQLHVPSGEITEIAGLRDEPTMPIWSPTGDAYVYTEDQSSIIVNKVNGAAITASAVEALSGEATWSPDGRAILLAPWNSGTQSTLVDLTGEEPRVSTVEIDFDASPPFLSPPQWAPAAPIPPEQNPSLLLPATPVAEAVS
jgi:Tol biopolymer transport system component